MWSEIQGISFLSVSMMPDTVHIKWVIRSEEQHLHLYLNFCCYAHLQKGSVLVTFLAALAIAYVTNYYKTTVICIPSTKMSWNVNPSLFYHCF